MPIDAAKLAEELAQMFFDLSNAVDDFRLRNYLALPPATEQQLKDEAQALDNRGQQLTAAALEAIVEGIQPHLENIQKATHDAKDALQRLDDVEKAIKIVDSSVALAYSIGVGDLGSIGDNVQGLFKTING